MNCPTRMESRVRKVEKHLRLVVNQPADHTRESMFGDGDGRLRYVNLILSTLLISSGCVWTSPLPVLEIKPLALLRTHSESTPSWWEGFHRPLDDEEAFQLVMLEPYQSGKIPVVLIHGLLSSPSTWAELLSACYADETIQGKYQYWVFHYPTGSTYLESAKQLRRQIASARTAYDPAGTDEALSKIILIGHSMGGLIAKLEITSSQDLMWNAIANDSFDQLICDNQTRQEIRDLLFFEPTPGIARVIYLATPHRGAKMTEGPLAKIGHGLVEFSSDARDRFEYLTDSNSKLFNRGFKHSIPTSIEHLSPQSSVMLATAKLPVSQLVKQHSIVSIKSALIGKHRGDSIVEYSSAHLHQTASELIIDAPHTKVQNHPHTIAEIRRILAIHLQHADTLAHNLKQTAVTSNENLVE